MNTEKQLVYCKLSGKVIYSETNSYYENRVIVKSINKKELLSLYRQKSYSAFIKQIYLKKATTLFVSISMVESLANKYLQPLKRSPRLYSAELQ